MKKFISGATALVLMAGVALAGGGGKIKFEPGTKHDALLAEAKASGKAVMLYFTADF
jgi:hypothetical protein